MLKSARNPIDSHWRLSSLKLERFLIKRKAVMSAPAISIRDAVRKTGGAY